MICFYFISFFTAAINVEYILRVTIDRNKINHKKRHYHFCIAGDIQLASDIYIIVLSMVPRAELCACRIALLRDSKDRSLTV